MKKKDLIEKGYLRLRESDLAIKDVAGIFGHPPALINSWWKSGKIDTPILIAGLPLHYTDEYIASIMDKDGSPILRNSK